MPEAPVPPFARALGRVPSGLYVVTTRGPAGPLGFVASFLIQVGLEPPTLAVAVGSGRDHLAALRAAGGFTVSVLDKASSGVMGAFFKKRADGSSPYDELDCGAAATGIPYIRSALAWLDCRVTGEHALGDHVVVFATVADGDVLREGEPSLHVRRDGRGY